MPRRKAWKNNVPETAADARRVLVDAARRVIERVGLAKAALSDVADEAGVTRQTVYRYFDNAEDLFHSAAALSTGGFHQRLRERAMSRATPAERLVECLVFAIRELPEDPHLEALVQTGDYFTVSAALRLGFVQEEISVLLDGDVELEGADREAIAELLLRLLHSYLVDPGPPRGQSELRSLLLAQLSPAIEARLVRKS